MATKSSGGQNIGLVGPSTIIPKSVQPQYNPCLFLGSGVENISKVSNFHRSQISWNGGSFIMRDASVLVVRILILNKILHRT